MEIANVTVNATYAATNTSEIWIFNESYNHTRYSRSSDWIEWLPSFIINYFGDKSDINNITVTAEDSYGLVNSTSFLINITHASDILIRNAYPEANISNGQNTTVKLEILNNGSTALTNFELNTTFGEYDTWVIGGAYRKSGNVNFTNISLSSGEVRNFTVIWNTWGLIGGLWYEINASVINYTIDNSTGNDFTMLKNRFRMLSKGFGLSGSYNLSDVVLNYKIKSDNGSYIKQENTDSNKDFITTANYSLYPYTMKWYVLEFYWNVSFITQKNLNTSNFKISWFNSTDWINITKGNPDWVNDLGKNTTYWWINLSNHSSYGLWIGTNEPTPEPTPTPTPAPESSSSGGGGGGGGGGGLDLLKFQYFHIAFSSAVILTPDSFVKEDYEAAMLLKKYLTEEAFGATVKLAKDYSVQDRNKPIILIGGHVANPLSKMLGIENQFFRHADNQPWQIKDFGYGGLVESYASSNFSESRVMVFAGSDRVQTLKITKQFIAGLKVHQLEGTRLVLN